MIFSLPSLLNALHRSQYERGALAILQTDRFRPGCEISDLKHAQMIALRAKRQEAAGGRELSEPGVGTDCHERPGPAVQCTSFSPTYAEHIEKHQTVKLTAPGPTFSACITRTTTQRKYLQVLKSKWENSMPVR